MTARRWRLAAAFFAAGLLASAALWRFWTPRCNEACPPAVVLGMYVTVVALPVAWAALGLVLASASQTPRRGGLLAVAMLLSVGLVVWLTRAIG